MAWRRTSTRRGRRGAWRGDPDVDALNGGHGRAQAQRNRVNGMAMAAKGHSAKDGRRPRCAPAALAFINLAGRYVFIMFSSTVVAASPPPNLKYCPSLQGFHASTECVLFLRHSLLVALRQDILRYVFAIFERIRNFPKYREFSSRSKYYIALPFKLFLLTS